MLNRLSRRLLVLITALSLGLGWPLLQAGAWLGMIAAYSADMSLTDAVGRTLGGRVACPVCLVAQKGQQQESDQGQRADTLPQLDLAVLNEEPDSVLDLDPAAYPPTRLQIPLDAPPSPFFLPPRA